MSDERDSLSRGRKPTRRQFAAITAGVTIGLSGCLGSKPDCADEQRQVGYPTVGPSDAPVVAIYFDYACPHCHDYLENQGPALLDAAENGDIQFQLRDFPLPVKKRWSWGLAYLGRAVQDQVGVDAFFAYVDELLPSDGYSEDKAVSAATAVGLSESQARQQFEGSNYCEAVSESKKEGKEAGVSGTPMLLAEWNDEAVKAPSAEEILNRAP